MYEGSLLVARISMVDVSQCASEQVWSWFLNPPQDLCCTLTGDLMVQCRHALENLKDLPIHLDITHQSVYQLWIREFFGIAYCIALLFSLISFRCQTCTLFAICLEHRSVYLYRISPQSHTGKENANSLYFLPQTLFFRIYAKLNKS